MKQVYECDFCKFTNKSKEVVALHEKRCFNNPDVHCCKNCAFHQNRVYVGDPEWCPWDASNWPIDCVKVSTSDSGTSCCSKPVNEYDLCENWQEQ